MLKQKLIGKYAESRVKAVQTASPIAYWDKPLDQAKVALITTAGVHLKTQPIFQVEEGDFSYRLIPADAAPDDLMISHTHYDRTDADQDVNCVFPLERLKELRTENMIGEVSPFHFGLQGYIPNPDPLIKSVGPELAAQLKAEQVDLAILSPG